MLSISNVGARQAGSYYNQDGYYARLTDSDNSWQGKLKDELGLGETVDHEDFNRLVKERKERAGYDLCFSAPKSVSIAMSMDNSMRADMIAAHNEAVKSVLAQIEEKEIGARVTTDKVTQHIKTGNMIAGCFNHYVSRNSDPQLHTHCVVLNKTKYNGKFYAVDNPDLYRNKMIYGQIYRNTLATELMNRGYSVAVTNPDKGFFELDGIDQATIDRFSTRRQEIVEKLKEWNDLAPEAAEKAALMTRAAKEHKDLGELVKSWKETVNEVGGIQVQKSEVPVQPERLQKEKDCDQGLKRLSRKTFAFTERELKRAILAQGVGSGLTEAEYEAYLKKKLHNDVVELGALKFKSHGDTYYTTKANLDMEKAIFQEIKRTKNSMAGLDKGMVDAQLKRILKEQNAPLSDQQYNAVTFLTSTKDKYCAVQGLAGVGKTYMLDKARQVFEKNGYEVLGACYTGKAAAGLQEDAHIPSVTIHSFLNKLEKEAGNSDPTLDFQEKDSWNLTGLKSSNKKQAWIVDEASMADNTAIRHLMMAADAKGAKVVFVGDRQQLLPVGVGNAFDTMVRGEKIGTAKLDEIRRQKNDVLLESVMQSVKGDISQSFELLDKEVRVIDANNKPMDSIIGEYCGLEAKKQNMTVVLSSTDQRKDALNQSIRDSLIKQGNLQAGKEFTVQDENGQLIKRKFAEKDKLIFMESDSDMGIKRGQIGVISKIDGDTMTIDQGNKTIEIDALKYNKIDHGYAMTTKTYGELEDKIQVIGGHKKRMAAIVVNAGIFLTQNAGRN